MGIRNASRLTPMLFILLPAFNEETALPRLLPRIDRVLAGEAYRVVVIDDGSADATTERALAAAREYPVTLLRHAVNRGLGAALATGLAFCLAEGGTGDAVVVMDCDDTHDPALIPRMVAGLAAGTEVVIASRFAPGGAEEGLTWKRRALSRGASGLLRAVLRIRGVRDYTSGYRAYSLALLRRAAAEHGERLVEERGFVCMVELLVKVAPFARQIGELPLQLRYDLKPGESKMNVPRTVREYLRFLARLLGEALTPAVRAQRSAPAAGLAAPPCPRST